MSPSSLRRRSRSKSPKPLARNALYEIVSLSRILRNSFTGLRCVEDKIWLSVLYSAANCRKMIDTGRITEHDGEMFCGNCYRKLFGPKGYGFGGLNMDDGKGYTVSSIEKEKKRTGCVTRPAEGFKSLVEEKNGTLPWQW